jgi:hypothetical protein
VAATLGQLQKRLQTRRILLSSGFSFNLPATTFPGAAGVVRRAAKKVCRRAR